MSRNLKHYQALDALVTHAPLALYCTISQQGGFWLASLFIVFKGDVSRSTELK